MIIARSLNLPPSLLFHLQLYSLKQLLLKTYVGLHFMFVLCGSLIGLLCFLVNMLLQPNSVAVEYLSDTPSSPYMCLNGTSFKRFPYYPVHVAFYDVVSAPSNHWLSDEAIKPQNIVLCLWFYRNMRISDDFQNELKRIRRWQTRACIDPSISDCYADPSINMVV